MLRSATAREEKSVATAIVDSDPATREQVREALEDLGANVTVCVDAAPSRGDASLVVIDLDRVGVESIPRLLLLHASARIICVSASAAVPPVVEAMRGGAFDYLVRPLSTIMLREALKRALRDPRSRSQSAQVSLPMVGDSPPMHALAAQIRRVQQSDVVVSLVGETGTGKELVARAIHEGGARSGRPFVAINCASIPQQLQESELFGHERGSFTGAVRLHRGCFEQANNGTLFLDEVAEMSLATQASLLRALQEHRIRRLGGTVDVPVDIRVICATHRDLAAEVQAGRFRKDLYFRLVVYPIRLAPLRERTGDILTLVAYFLEKFGKGGVAGYTICDDALRALSKYDWPGNVRELENVAHRILLSSDGETIQLEHLPQEIQALVHSPSPQPSAPPPAPSDSSVVPFRELERTAILQALETTRGSIDEAARLLGVSRATLYRRLARFKPRNATAIPSTGG